jgi:hypothetical protein
MYPMVMPMTISQQAARRGETGARNAAPRSPPGGRPRKPPGRSARKVVGVRGVRDSYLCRGATGTPPHPYAGAAGGDRP